MDWVGRRVRVLITFGSTLAIDFRLMSPILVARLFVCSSRCSEALSRSLHSADDCDHSENPEAKAYHQYVRGLVLRRWWGDTSGDLSH